MDRRHWVIVSGASGSIGSGLVDAYISKGHPVLALDREEFQTDTESPSALVARAADLASQDQIQAVLEDSIPRTAKIGLLANAVGMIWSEPILSLRGAKFQPHGQESWAKVIEANLTAPFLVAAQVAARMARTGGGSIVNFSSIAGRGNIGQAAYSAAKSGIEGLTKTMASELGPFGIRVNAIAPGFIDVPSTHAALSEGQLTQLSGQTPLRRVGTLDEVLNAVAFLSENEFVTGVVLDVNGGLRL